MSEWARRMEGEVIPSDRPNENIFLYKKPIGVVAGIIPWNFPFFILARKVATALVTGCTIVIKPSQHTPNTTMEFTKIIDAIEKANDTDYGLSSSVYTNDLNEAMRAVNEMKFGETFVNRENFEAVQGYHAGMRQSGLGGTDGKHGLEDFLVTQIVYMQYKNDKK